LLPARPGKAGFVGIRAFLCQAALIFRLFHPGSPGYKETMMNPIAFLILQILNIYEWVVIVAVIVSWLTAFNVINEHNNFVRSLLRVLIALTEPVFRQIRRIIPPISGLDLSPIIVILLIETIKYTIGWMSFRYGF
jgi:YggT family protein